MPKKKHTRQKLNLPSDVRKDLWVQTNSCGDRCSGRHYVALLAPIYPGRFKLYCPVLKDSFGCSLTEVKRASSSAKLWINGFIYGSAPIATFDVLGNLEYNNRPLYTAFNKGLQKYFKTGVCPPVTNPLPPAPEFNWMLQIGISLGILCAKDVVSWAKQSLPSKGESTLYYKWDRCFEWIVGIAACSDKEELLALLKRFGGDDSAIDSFSYLVALVSEHEDVQLVVNTLRDAANYCFADDFWHEQHLEITASLDAIRQSKKAYSKFIAQWTNGDPKLTRLALAPIRFVPRPVV